MTVFYEIRDRLYTLYSRYSTWFDILWKFALAMASFLWIRSTLGESSLFSNNFILLIAALLCSVLPTWSIPVLSAAFIIGNSFAVSLEAGGVAALVLMILFLLFMRLVPEDAAGLAMTPVAMALGMPALMPILFGLRRKPSSIVTMISGAVVFYMTEGIAASAPEIAATAKNEYIERLKLVMATFASSRELVVMMLAFAGVLVIVYAIRRLEADYAFSIAIIAGGVVFITFSLLSNRVVGTRFGTALVLLGTVISVFAALVIQFFILSLDYKKTEHLEFEDDDYYYFVRAIPKLNASRYERYDEDEEDDVPEIAHPDVAAVNFEKKLEDSLKNL